MIEAISGEKHDNLTAHNAFFKTVILMSIKDLFYILKVRSRSIIDGTGN